MYRAIVTLGYKDPRGYKVEHKVPPFLVECRNEIEAKSRATQIALSALNIGGPITREPLIHVAVVEVGA